MKHRQLKSTCFFTARLFLTILIVLNIPEAHAQGRIIINGGKINIANGAVVVIGNANANAITRMGSGHIISEGENNQIRWNIGTTAGSFIIPWGSGGSSYFPVSFSLSAAAGTGYIYFSTVPTAAQNSLSLPTGITHFNGANGEDISQVAVDRYWKIDPQGYTSKPTFSNLLFTYQDTEFAAPNKTTVENKLTAIRWNSNTPSWTDYNTGATVNTAANTVTIPSITGTNFNSWWSVAYPGGSYHWIAATNSTWNSAANWSLTAGGNGGAGVPSSGDAVYFDNVRDGNCAIDTNLDFFSIQVAAGYSGAISQGSQSVSISHNANFTDGLFQGGNAAITIEGDLTVAGSSFTSTSGTLDLKKNFVLTNGSFIHNNGTLQFSGTGTQRITSSSALAFNHLNVINTTGLINESNSTLAGVLNLAANVTFDPDGQSNNKTFTLLSAGDNPTKDAAIGILPTGAKVDGNVIVQRYMAIEGASGGRIYRYISSPIKSAAVSDIQNEIQVTGPFTGSSKCTGCASNQSMFAYDESIITDNTGDAINNQNDGYINFPKTSNTEILAPGRGYTLFVRGNIISSARWDVKGIINAGNVSPVSLPVSYTSSGVTANDGWNLVGNPFPSTIDWSAGAGWTKTNLNNAIYIRDNGNTVGQYATWNGVVGTNGGSRYIATGQAFWVKASGAGVPSLVVNENVKAPGTQTSFFREQSPTKVLRIALKQGAINDEAIVHFRDDASADFDANADALKLPNTTFNLSTQLTGKDKMAINSLSSIPCNNTILVAVDNVSNGSYTLQFSSLETFPTSTIIALTDNFTGKSINLQSGNEYAFTVTSDPLTYSSARFSLSVSWPEDAADFSLAAQPVCEGSTANVAINNTRNHYSYAAMVGEATLSITSASATQMLITVPHENLTDGKNLITVRSIPSGCGLPVEKSIELEVEQIPSVSSVTGAFTCREGTVTLKASGGNTGNIYRWYETESSSPLAESLDSTFTTPVLKKSKTYFVSIANQLGCEGERVSVIASVVQYADASIAVVNDSLKINYESGVQWYKDGVALPGEQAAVIYPDASGLFTVSVNVQGCITSTDYVYAGRTEVITGTNDEKEVSLSAYPNPVINDLFLTTASQIKEVQDAGVYNLQGQLVGKFIFEQTTGVAKGIFSMKGRPAGLYIVRVVTSEWIKEIKIIKE